MPDIDTATADLRDLARKIGGGFHPDIAGENYSSLPDGVTPADVDRITDAAIEAGVDAYAVALDVAHEEDEATVVKRQTVRATVTLTANPDDLVDLSHPDLVGSIEARCTETYATPAAHEVRWTVDNVTTQLVEVDASPDYFTVLLNRLDTALNFHEANSDPDDPDDPDLVAAAAIAEAIDLLKTHALPEDHPQANR